jgi:hypothetical protein
MWCEFNVSAPSVLRAGCWASFRHRQIYVLSILKLTESLEVELMKMSVISTKLEWAKVIVLIIRRIYISMAFKRIRTTSETGRNGYL